MFDIRSDYFFENLNHSKFIKFSLLLLKFADLNTSTSAWVPFMVFNVMLLVPSIPKK